MTRAGFVAAVVAGVLAFGAPAAPRVGASPASTSLDYAYAIAIQRDRKLVVAGRSAGGHWTFALARYTGRGKLDGTFGRRGRVRTDVGRRGYSWADVATALDVTRQTAWAKYASVETDMTGITA